MRINQKGFANIILIAIIMVLTGAVGYFALRKPVAVNQQPTPSSAPLLLSEGESFTIAKQTVVTDLKIAVNTDCLVFVDKKETNFITYTVTQKFNDDCLGDPTSAPAIPQLKVDRLSRAVLIQSFDGEFRPLSSSPKQTANPTSTPPLDKTGNWKTYTNIKFGFEFIYPVDWKITEETLSDLELKQTNGMDGMSFHMSGYKGEEIPQSNDCPIGIHVIECKKSESDFHVTYARETNTGQLAYSNQKQLNAYFSTSKANVQIVTLLTDQNGKALSFLETSTLVFDRVLKSLKFVPISITSDTAKPVITSILPASGASGTVVEIRGSNLSGFEGDLIAVFKRSDGKTVELNSIVPYYSGHTGDPVNTTLIKVKVEPPCQKGQTVYGPYSGKPSVCDYFEFTPGIYKVYVNPWGKKSNEVEFIVI